MAGTNLFLLRRTNTGWRVSFQYCCISICSATRRRQLPAEPAPLPSPQPKPGRRRHLTVALLVDEFLRARNVVSIIVERSPKIPQEGDVGGD